MSNLQMMTRPPQFGSSWLRTKVGERPGTRNRFGGQRFGLSVLLWRRFRVLPSFPFPLLLGGFSVIEHNKRGVLALRDGPKTKQEHSLDRHLRTHCTEGRVNRDLLYKWIHKCLNIKLYISLQISQMFNELCKAQGQASKDPRWRLQPC